MSPGLANAALVALVAVLAAAATAQAERAEPALRDQSAELRPLRVKLSLGARSLDGEAVRTAIERELRIQVVRADEGDAALEVEVQPGNRVRVRYTRPEGEELTRSVDLPKEPERAVEVIALLSGNLVRNEASELAEALRRPEETASEPASSAAAGPLPAPAPPPPPAQRSRGRGKHARKRAPTRNVEENQLMRRGPVSANLTLYHPVATHSDTERRVFNLELGLAYSNVGAIEGQAFQLGVLEVEQHAHGWAAAVLWAKADGPVRGALTSFFVTESSTQVQGAELAGLVAVADEVVGLQAAGVLSHASRVRGAQLSGVFGRVEHDVTGFAGAAGVTVADDVDGALGSGGLNLARQVEGAAITAGMNLVDEVNGVALAPLNVNRKVTGAQIGIVNVGQRVEGVQLGVVNVASEVDGTAFGVASIAGNGRVQPTFFTSTAMPLHASIKFQVGYAYSEAGMAYAPDSDRFAIEAGGGAHVPLFERVSLELGVHYSDVHEEANPERDLEHWLHYRARAALRLSSWFEIFAGGGLQHGIAGEVANEVKPELLTGISLL